MPEANPTTTPEPFTPANDASSTLQAQHSFSNDTPTDVNANACLARSQVLSVDALGKGFVAAQERRQGLFDHCAAVLAGKLQPT